MAPDPEDGRGGWWPEGDPGEERRGEGEGEGERPGKPPRGLATPGAPKPASRYSMFVGLAFVAIIIIALLNLIGNDDTGIVGVSSGEEGTALAEFAVADAFGTSDADANVFQDDCDSPRNPCPQEDERVPACEISAEQAIRLCDLFDKPLAISFWFTRGGDCTPTQDAFDAVAASYRGRVNFLSVNVRDERETVTRIAEEGGWEVPLGLDPDGAVSNLYRVGGCPTIEFAYPGGIFQRAEIGDRDVAEITGFVEELLQASRERAATSR